MSKEIKNVTNEKNIEFTNVLELFKKYKGKYIDIKNDFNDDKYSIRVYNNISHTIGNFNIKYRANVHILFIDNTVQVTPCKRGEFLYRQTKIFKPNDNIMKMKDLLPNDYLTSLGNYMR